MQSVDIGILPSLYAATSPDATPGGYYSPNGFLEVRGEPTAARLPRGARDETAAVMLWDISEELTGVRYCEHAIALSR